MKKRTRAILAATLVLAIPFAVIGAGQALAARKTKPTTPTTTTEMVMGYYTVYYAGDPSSYNSLSSNSTYLNAISTMTYNLSSTGDVTGTAPSDGITLATSKNISSYAAITNQTDGTFDGAMTHAVLSDATKRQTAINDAVALVKNNGYRGVNLDFESIQAGDRAAYTQFATDMATALHSHGAKLVVSVPAKTSDSPTNSWSGAFDYAALGRVADTMQLMTYDEHGSWGAPGPVASLPWVTQVVQYAVSQTPSSKIIIGLAAYGYDWNTTTDTDNKAVSWKNIPSLISTNKATAHWDAMAQSPSLNYTAADGSQHTVWYENSQSITAKTKLVGQYSLGGVSMWRMGLEDATFWQAVQSGLQ